jgi:hypothetical protein
LSWIFLMAKAVEHFSHINWPLGLHHLKKSLFCSFSIHQLDYLWFWCLTFRVLYIFWILIRWISGKVGNRSKSLLVASVGIPSNF